MKLNTLGVVLSYYRKKYNLPQAAICDGICSTVTLFRIEKGEREVDSLVSEVLSQRVGKHILEFELLLNEEDYKLLILRNDIRNKLEKSEYDMAEMLLEEYHEVMPEDLPVHEQFYCYGQYRILKGRDSNHKQIIDMAKKALSYTKDLNKKTDLEQLYSGIELELSFELEKECTNRYEKEEKLLKLLVFVNKYYSKKEKEDAAIPILLELIEMNIKEKNEKKALEYINQAINLISEGRTLKMLSKLHFEKAKLLLRLYGIQKREECIRECLMAYYTAQVRKEDGMEDKIKKFCEDELKWQITE